MAYCDTDTELTGRQIYTQCTGCHAYSYHRTGPKHCGLFGRQAGSADGFDFTDALKQSGIVWSEKTLDQFLKSPIAMVPGTSMGIVGIKSQSDRTKLITFLSTLNDNNALCR